jgi:hypothetical protein
VKNQIRLDIERREPFAGGVEFGTSGPYERLYGKVHFAVDPDEPGLPYICDLDLAPRNAEGLVEFAAILDIVKPVDLARGSDRVLYEFSNRGGRGAFRYSDAAGMDMSKPEFAGNGFLQRYGYTVVWSGWQGDLIDRGSNVVAFLPEAMQDGKRLRGTVRQEFIVGAPGVYSMGVSAGAERGADVQPYPVLDRSTATLTVRELERDPRMPVPDGDWDLARAELKDGALELTPSDEHLYVKGGFKPGFIYELIYETEGSRVMGLGFLGVRDLLSFLKYGDIDSAGTPNPLAGHVEKLYGFGVSLSGRVVRQYIYEGWNADTQGRRVMDGVHTHTGSGRLLHNQRFAQVGRYPRQHEEHSWPSEYYPFTFTPVPDPFSEKNEGLLSRPDTDPVIVHTHTSSDYWERHVSTTHTDPSDGSDVEMPDTARMYQFTGAPHMARAVNDPAWVGQLTPNSMSPAPYMRACLVLLDEWVTKGAAPPKSLVPRRDEGAMISPEEALSKFPKIPGVNLPAGPSRLPNYDYGPEFDKGYASVFPPLPIPGQDYPIQVSSVDSDGNDIPGLRYPDVDVPVGTHAPWALRRAGFAEGELLWNCGSFIPFARTKAERLAANDPRPSIEERYAGHDDYVSKVAAVCQKRVAERLMLQEDADRYIAAAKAKDPFDPSVALGPLIQSGFSGAL